MIQKEIVEIHIDWEGPFQREQIKEKNSKKDYGIYQFYGYHPIYGMDTLLYIGKAQEMTFSSRINSQDHKGMYLHKYWTPDSVSLYLGRLKGTKTPSDEAWSEKIRLAEKLLIYAHSPAGNSQGVKLDKKRLQELFNVHLFNWGKHKRLLPEVSGRRYMPGYPKPENYNTYTL